MGITPFGDLILINKFKNLMTKIIGELIRKSNKTI